VELRPPQKDDAPAIVDVTHRWGFPDETVADIEMWFELPSIDLERNARVVVRDGEVVGYGDVGDRSGDGKLLWLDARGDGDALPVVLDFLERRAVELAKEDAKLKVWSPEPNGKWRSLLEARGYELDRYSFQMRMDLPDRLPAPDWPKGITVRTFRKDEDEQAVYETHQETFSDQRDVERDPFDEWQQWSYRAPFDPQLWFLALDGEELAGVLLGRGERGGDTTLGWVNILGVRKPWRGRGLGLALLQHAFLEFQRRGRVRAGLGVDGANPGAVRLYERAGMSKAQVFVWYQRSL
jgi:mycothiol synthase